jgi:hypothetical protein
VHKKGEKGRGVSQEMRRMEGETKDADRSRCSQSKRQEENKVKKEVEMAKRLCGTSFDLATNITMSSTMLTEDASMDVCDAIDGGRQQAIIVA